MLVDLVFGNDRRELLLERAKVHQSINVYILRLSKAFVPSLEMCIIREMFHAEVEPMPSNPPDRVTRSGLWKVTIYEGERFVRTDKENMIISVAEKLAEELNYQFGHNPKGRGA